MGAAEFCPIETPRLTLRPLGASDAPVLSRIGGDARVAPMLGTLRSPWPEPEVRQWIARARFRGTPAHRLGVVLKGGPLIGTVGLAGAPHACVYFLAPGQWGKGYATEALRAFLSACFVRFGGLDVVTADHFADNPASGRVLRRLGFRRVGQGAGRSLARVEPAPNIHYRLFRREFEAIHEVS
ncbi:RimJ/RimL family protein N-acetyltransferase [Rhodovulum imhoffii]|uniref:RimJ/RimL family protein N-acetyltransferase n=1 Tax=Rhodovulum imhoffii TaxID=365340 RepID=A0A2T5BT75_9RHOB|nr:GNAT family N-acetyltransferase [Rhodovulum imhoffii]MBK5932968.1 hypothetical protein [Rhodovulum imhoffii]PTN02636.1 RimJ/RimL family protein N-acetyltransferase [Rhodovulum imhoffii]